MLKTQNIHKVGLTKNDELFRQALKQHAFFIGQMFGEGNEPVGQMAVIVDAQVSTYVMGTYLWTEDVTVFNPFNPNNSKKVSGEVATLIAMIHIIQRITDGVYTETNYHLLDAIDNAKQLILKQDSEAYYMFVD